MSKSIIIKNKIDYFNKVIKVSGDKSISIRWILFSSLAKGISKAKNLLLSEDVLDLSTKINDLNLDNSESKKNVQKNNDLIDQRFKSTIKELDRSERISNLKSKGVT